MRSILVPLYWSWCALSVFILVRRRLRRTATSADTPVAAADAVESTGIPATAEQTDTADAEPVPAAPVLATVGGTRHDAAPDPGEFEPAVARAIAEAERATDHEPAAAGDAIAAAGPLSTTDSLAEALDGIRLPCELAPLVGTGEFHPRELVLVTTDHPAEVVGRSLADELERLGFGLEGVDHRTILARDERSLVEVGLFSDSIADASGARAFPTAPAGSVVARFRLR